MSVGSVLKEVRQNKDISQQAVGDLLYRNKSDICRFEKGKQIPYEVMVSLGPKLDDPKFYMAAVMEVSGGAYATPWLDGPVDLHRIAVWAKTREELHEAYDAVTETKAILIPPPNASTEQREDVHRGLMEMLDARVAVDHCIAIICREYGFSVTELFVEHRTKLETRGYLTRAKKKTALTSGR